MRDGVVLQNGMYCKNGMYRKMGCTAKWAVLQNGLYCKMGCTYLIYTPASSVNLPAHWQSCLLIYLPILLLSGKLPPIGGDGGGLDRRMCSKKIRVRRLAASVPAPRPRPRTNQPHSPHMPLRGGILGGICS